MNLNEIKQLIDENLPDELSRFEPEDIDKELLNSIQFVLGEIRNKVDRAVERQQKQFLMS
jgi:hypothetical protein